MASLAIKTVHMVELNAMEYRLVLMALKGELEKEKDILAAKKLGEEMTELRDTQMADRDRKAERHQKEA